MDEQLNNIIVNKGKKGVWKIVAFSFIALFAINLFFSFFEVNIVPRQSKWFSSRSDKPGSALQKAYDEDKIISAVLPKEGAEIPATWGDLGKRLIEAGVIDKSKFEALYEQRGELGEEARSLLEENNNGRIIISQENANTLLNLLWALGLGNKNPILEEGPMTDPRYGGAGNFASTGGWTLAKGGAMDHYSKHRFLELNEQQQESVERVARSIYRPCCGNSTYFPDCNHGMAMMGLLELMAVQGANEEEMYKAALQVNSYWFPQTYLTIAKYFEKQGVEWRKVDPKLALGESFSSASGYSRILSEIEPVKSGGGGGCGV